MDFSQRWHKIIFQYVSTTSYQILLNGQIGRQFKASRGLKQGDLLPPYLFLLCVEGLSANISNLEALNCNQGVKVRRKAHQFPIYYLLMIAIFFVEPTAPRLKPSRSAYSAFNKHQDNMPIYPSQK